MANKISIDDLFRNGLSQGEEPMNEGAWSNMSKMLDGENPYDKSESRKRRWTPWLWGGALIMVLSTIVVVWSEQNKSTHKRDLLVQTTSSPSLDIQKSPETITNSHSTGKEKNNDNSRPKQPSESQSSLPSANTSKPSGNTASSNPNQTKTNYQSSSAQTENADAYNPGREAQQPSNSASEAQAVALNSPQVELSNPANIHYRETSKVKRKAPRNAISSKQNTDVTNQTKNNLDEPLAVAKSFEKPTTSEIIPDQDRISKKITKVELSEKSKRDRSGNAIQQHFDTLAISEREETIVKKAQWEPQADAFGKYHPRYVPMNAADDAQAGFKISLDSKPLTEVKPMLAQNITSTPDMGVSSNKVANANATSLAAQEETKHSKVVKETTLERLRVKSAILGADFAAKTGKSCPGMSMGVHAAFKNPENNFGGFQFGLNNLKPFGDYFSLLTEIKFFIRNNSGYTIRDIMTSNKNLSMDTVSSPTNTIYSYQIDSSSYLYNFKHFYGLELPVMFQFHYRRLSAYAGLNMAYQFRLQTSTMQRNYVLNRADTISSQMPFYLPNEQGRDVSKDDFKARLGLGLVGGLSYSFTPQLYVDMRIVQNLNDNAQTLSARAVSANTFKVPSIQLSLGYRFRKFVPAQ